MKDQKKVSAKNNKLVGALFKDEILEEKKF